jgi:hypothetical protein
MAIIITHITFVIFVILLKALLDIHIGRILENDCNTWLGCYAGVLRCYSRQNRKQTILPLKRGNSTLAIYFNSVLISAEVPAGMRQGPGIPMYF